MSQSDLKLESLKPIKAIAMDVDGVLTDCRIWLDASGEWRRSFCIRDGVGIKRLQAAGYKIGWITGTKSQDIQERIKVLGIEFLREGKEDKSESFAQFAEYAGCEMSEVAYIGDDLPDLALFKLCGFSATVPQAVSEVLNAAQYVTTAKGGEGAAREVCDLIFEHGFHSAAPQQAAKSKFRQG